MRKIFDRSIPRLLILLIDIAICFGSLFLAYLIRFNFEIPEVESSTFYYVFPFVVLSRTISFFVVRTYAGIIRYTNTRDAMRILLTMAVVSGIFVVSNGISYFTIGHYIVPFSIIIIEFLLSVFIMITGRLLVKVTYNELKNPSGDKSGVIIYGAGEAGLITKRTLDRDKGTRYKVVAFVDDSKNKAGKKLEGIPIFHSSRLEELQQNYEVKHLIIAIQNISSIRKQQIVDTCLKYNTRILNVPPVKSWINGELSFKQIRKLNIEDLLGRDPIQLDLAKLRTELGGKVVLVTGAAGSIGSEIVRQIIAFRPKLIVMVDMAESPLYDLELEVTEHPFDRNSRIESVIGDIRNIDRMRNVFKTFKPDIVYHAAAYKHVPVMENNPSESILNNVLGTCILADLAVEFHVPKFVMVSTDKAVNPTNIMGATKRIAEIYCQSLNNHNPITRFITTRFGNVLGSNGSVIPRFKKQIEMGQPITVTHPEVTRFFMTIPEACQLVLEAGAMGKGGEIFIFDMGESVNIADLAKKMIRLSGLELGKDIQIIYSGLRPGEKLYEELLASEENTIPTHHQKIMIAKVKEYNFETISNDINDLIALFNAQNNEMIVKKMKEIVPEFISQNSVYEKLDEKINESKS
ncbi:MAG TPA: nucleoside-diphosphate sugar epimerase/dehydratase [Bacteroidia bacterium]|nr:nucleoside-diphosphate sugar epimerase/dehydratase [Bacteroidia bacterium]HQK97195.1 nucleoside-diphosphate sugar epimerase/dehydratase [Bacteroidia bacterium]